VGVCEHGHAVLGRSSCGSKYCEDHWRDWCEDAVISIVARLAAYRHVQEGAEKRLSHVVASPPQDRRYSVEQLWETRSDAYDALEASGLRGGVTVTHPYRTTERADNLYHTARESGELEEGVGKWRFLRDLADDWEDLEGYVEASPHYHSLAAGTDIRGQDAPEGWVVERIRTMKPFHHIRDTEAYKSMVAPAYYVLTHSAEQQGGEGLKQRQGTTYFGEIHPSAFDPSEELTRTAWQRIQIEAEKAVKGEEPATSGGEECPRNECDAPVYDVAHLPDLLDDEEWVEKVRSGRNGQARYDRLKGVLLWWEGRCDTPPPSVRSSKSRFRGWLEDLGAVHSPNPSQVSLGTILG
jgi:hypothetical protein